ncbi:hypothetical protein G6O69_22240 [Pseudenhygromyxa sp. WMMC2535]|uniref:hypothetical protein n=1 Tax=Pseudenhygromyxa sp. WMMC2535 TaxID=2712867 RepID=UPI001555D2E5|nr:hypothetical protein [Pseudenhygromyxa sp. WMMC2535]NVB40577.1 hypothetical protein [Pseudenhygromyxa sp. WMMC2535]
MSAKGQPDTACRRTGVQLRARALTIACLIGATFGGGCRCKGETLAPIVFDENEDREPIDPAHVLAPPWQAPAIAQLDNGALLHWLREVDSPAFHLRVLLPTSIHAERLTAAEVAVALEALELRLSARLRRIGGVKLALRSRPGRVELAVHGRDVDAEAVIAAVADSLADAGNPKLLSVAQGKVLAARAEVEPATVAAAALIATLTNRPLEHELIIKDGLIDLSKGREERSWSLLTDPRDATIIVHSGLSLEDEGIAQSVAYLSERWHARLALRSGEPSVTARLRGQDHVPRKPAQTWLMTESSPAAMSVYAGEPGRGGRGEVMLGRLIPTPTAKQRILIRLCQRLMQEELDARLIDAGPISVFAVRVRISPDDPVRSLTRIIERIQAFGGELHPRDRVEQAARLWLGARVVAASLQGEDWTALWSESIDLASEDREIFTALAREAEEMLAVEPEDLREAFAQWFDPRGGEPGWVWVGAGIDEAMATKLEGRIELLRVE